MATYSNNSTSSITDAITKYANSGLYTVPAGKFLDAVIFMYGDNSASTHTIYIDGNSFGFYQAALDVQLVSIPIKLKAAQTINIASTGGGYIWMTGFLYSTTP